MFKIFFLISFSALMVGVYSQSLPFDTNSTNKKGDTVIITGTVKDSLNTLLANVRVTIFLSGGLESSITTTNSSGKYEFKLINSNASKNVDAFASSSSKVGMAKGTINKPTDGITDIVEINITIGKMQAFSNRISQIRSYISPSHTPSYYSISGQKITKACLFMNKNLSTQIYINKNALINNRKSLMINM